MLRGASPGGRWPLGAIVLVLLLINATAHFVPFERPGLEPDDFRNLRRMRENRVVSMERAWAQPDRPVSWLMQLWVADLVRLDPGLHLPVVLVGSSVLVLAALVLFLELTRNRDSAMLMTTIFALLPAHHALHGGLLFATSAAAAAAYLTVAALVLRFLRTGDIRSLALSLGLYAVGLFSYELGILVPFCACAISGCGERRRTVLLAFAALAFLYVVRRFSLAAQVPLLGPARVPSFQAIALNLAWVLPAQVVGHIAARNVVYGLWGFLHQPASTQALSLLAALCVARLGHDLQSALPTLSWRQYSAAAATAVMLTLPACLVLVESRHMVLADAALATILASVMAALARWRAWVPGSVLAVLLLANQGIALRQAEAGRLSTAMMSAMARVAVEAPGTRAVLLDLHSIARRVPYTWRPHAREPLGTYWGLYMFTAWSLRDMLALAGLPGAVAVACLDTPRIAAGVVGCSRTMRAPMAGDGVAWNGPATSTVVLGYDDVCEGHPGCGIEPSPWAITRTW